jgi:phytoene synthase
VRKGGLEPPHLAALEPKSSASTNSATFAPALLFAGAVYYNHGVNRGAPSILSVTPEQYCIEKAAPAGSTLYYSFLFLPAGKRAALNALFAFREEVLNVPIECVDTAIARMKLAWWRGEVRTLHRGAPQHPVVQALAASSEARAFPLELWDEIIDGVELDLFSTTYPDFDALNLYCERTGATVLKMAAEIGGYEDPQTLEFATDLGIGMVLAQLIRQAGEHARRGRIYFPQDEMAEHGVSNTEVLRFRETESFSRLMEFETARAKRYLAAAKTKLPRGDRRTQRGLLALARMCEALLVALGEDEFRVLSRRTSLTPIRKLWMAWSAR